MSVSYAPTASRRRPSSVAVTETGVDNLAVAPKAKLDDGLIDISIIDKIPLDHILITAPMAFMNLLDHSQHAEMFRAKEILIEGNVHKWVNIDGEGENLGDVLHFVNHPKSIKIFGRK